MVVVLVIAGYPLVSFVPPILGVTSTPISILFRFIYVALSLVVIGVVLMKRHPVRLNIGHIMFFIFWFIYSIRLFTDLSILSIPLYEDHDAFYFYSLAFGGALIPSLAIIFKGKSLDVFKSLELIYKFYFAFAIILIILLAAGSSISYFHNGRLFANENLNSISTGHAGGSLALLALAFLFNNSTYRFSRIWLYVAIFLGMGIAFYSGSRSPLVVVALVVMVFIMRVLMKRRINAKLLNSVLVLVTALVLVGTFYIVPKLDSGEFKVVERLNKSGGEQEVRKTVWLNAAYQFINNPIVGDQFLERSNGKYPHNILLEVPMATGLLGTIPFIIMLIALGKRVLYLFLHEPLAMPLLALFFQFFLWNLTSGSLFGSGGLWLLIILLLTVTQAQFDFEQKD